MAMTPEEWEKERRKNDASGKHGTGTKGQNKADHPGGDRHDNEGHPKDDQRDDKYDS